WNNYSGEYRLRVTLAPAPWQLESEDNNAVNQANVPVFVRDGTNQWAKVFGHIRQSDVGDLFALHYLSLGRVEPLFTLPENTEIRLSLAKPSTSLLQPILELVNNSGTVVASQSAGNTNLVHTIPAGAAGRYYARVRAGAGTEGILSQYFLTIEQTIPADLTPPFIVSDTIPPEGATVGSIVDRFTLVFSEELSPATVNASSAYELRSAGEDDSFDTGDDVFYSIVNSPAYVNGSNASYLVSDGPLQPGRYRLTVRTNLQDLNLNSLSAPYVRTFSVTNVNGFFFEGRNNDAATNATSLSLNAGQVPDGSFR
ncbi:MAG: Ig-like domain-containing protein, partial [Limisphaerales bacterium]